MKKFALLWIYLLFLSSVKSSELSPVDQFIDLIFPVKDPSFGERWEEDQGPMGAGGGYLFQIDLVFPNMPVKWKFIATDRNSERGSLNWCCYSKTGNADWKLTRKFFRICEVCMKIGKSNLSLFYCIGNDQYVRFNFFEDGNLDQEVIRLSDQEVKDLELRKYPLFVEKIMLPVYLENPQKAWRKYNDQYDCFHQMVDSEDAIELKKIGRIDWRKGEEIIREYRKKRDSSTISSIASTSMSNKQKDTPSNISLLGHSTKESGEHHMKHSSRFQKSHSFDFYLIVSVISLGFFGAGFSIFQKLRKKSTSREK